jgi:ribonucleoside-diphosphate reductase alpha chain
MYTYQEALEESTKYFNGNEYAARIFVDKYALKNGNIIMEKTPDAMHHRLAKEFARIQKKKYGNKALSEEEIYSYLKDFSKIIPQGSPCFAIGNPYQIASISNCFVVESPIDSYGGICKTDEELAQISKRRGGVGADITNIRHRNTPTKNSSRYSTGILLFMNRYSNTIREVGQDGRRGALMLSCDIHHPESVIPWDPAIHGEEFETEINNKELGKYKISSKWYNPKVLDFATSKYDSSKVTGANISLRLSDEFLNAVENDTTFEKRWPPENPTYRENISARAVWDKIIYSAWRTAEPGILFWDNIIRESPADCYSDVGFKTISTNPCSEIPLSANDSCRLLVINLFAFVRNPYTKDAYFDYEEFYKVSEIAQRLMDDIVDLEEECIERIISKIQSDPESVDIKSRELSLWKKMLIACQNGRRTGTGITALGDTLAAINVNYGSKEGVDCVGNIYKVMKFGCFSASVDMAEELGAFPVWDRNKEVGNPFLNRIREETVDLRPHETAKGNESLFISGAAIWEKMQRVGRRNIACLTTAPVGTISSLTKLLKRFGSTSGVEPHYSWSPYTRKKKGNPTDQDFRTDSVDQNGDHWMHFKIYPTGIQEWIEATGNENIKESPFYGNTAEEIDWELRVELQSAAQKHIDHAISSTVNLPNSATVEDVAKVYNAAWKKGCKGITVYRDKCRTGVLVKDETPGIPVSITKTTAPKRLKSMTCEVYHSTVKGEVYFVVIGLLDGQPYEVFAGQGDNIKSGKGTLHKVSRGHYRLTTEHGESIENICDLLTDEQAVITRMISLSLRHGSDIQFIVDQIEKSPGDMYGFGKAVGRILKKYIPDGAKVSGQTCETCGGTNLVRQEGCISCKDCGNSKCG